MIFDEQKQLSWLPKFYEMFTEGDGYIHAGPSARNAPLI